MKPSWKVVKPALVSAYTSLSVSSKLTTQTLVSPIYVFCKFSLSAFMSQNKIPKNRCKMLTEGSYNQYKYHYSFKFSTKNNEKNHNVKVLSYPQANLWTRQAVGKLCSHISSSFLLVALLKWDSGTLQLLTGIFLFYSKKTFMCMDGQEQAMSDSVH